MAVRQQDFLDLDLRLLGRVEQAFGLSAWIDERGPSGRRAPHQRCVLTEGRHRDNQRLDGADMAGRWPMTNGK